MTTEVCEQCKLLNTWIGELQVKLSAAEQEVTRLAEAVEAAQQTAEFWRDYDKAEKKAAQEDNARLRAAVELIERAGDDPAGMRFHARAALAPRPTPEPERDLPQSLMGIDPDYTPTPTGREPRGCPTPGACSCPPTPETTP